MADPLTVATALLAIITTAAQSTKSLFEAIKRFNDRDKTLRRLQDELEDLERILASLAKSLSSTTAGTGGSMFTLLQGPIERCSQVCGDFELSMKSFRGKTKTGLRDWAKLEFMRGDIGDFINTITGYKSTISVGLGTITMHRSNVSHDVLVEFAESVKDTSYNLELHLLRIEEKLALCAMSSTGLRGANVDLEDEEGVTKQCLRICEDAKAYMDSLFTLESVLETQTDQENACDSSFDAQVRTRQTLEESRMKLAHTVNHLTTRLQSIVLEEGSHMTDERRLFQSDIDLAKQCLDVCKIADGVSRQKIYRVREAINDGDSDQVIVNSMADLFDVGKALSINKSAQLIASVTPENLDRLIEQRYSSRFGMAVADTMPTGSGTTERRPASASSDGEYTVGSSKDEIGLSSRSTKHAKPISNEMRKRQAGDVPKNTS